MKRMILFFCCLSVPAVAVAPSTSCPSGYISVGNDTNITVATSCPSGTLSVGTASSCLASDPSGTCLMYAPAGVPYTDERGIYEFTDVCELR
ncbi:MAG: hypothetical protein IKB05_02905 [Alphaproteobacteria bacterium]|nr:hypothetical protein [Alphaproteobacteria bacterium]MBR2393414.1 hypothetical protein [Alphaproteobacteria bacterium]